jgi:hypothetical protein
MDDVDLLVKAKDMWRVYKALSRADIKLQKISWDEAKYRNGSIILEVKSKMSDLPKLNPWADASRVAIASIGTLTLSPEVFLAHICLHADRHFTNRGRARLLWWFDIARLLEHYRDKFKWNYVIQIAREHEVEEAIHRVLHMAKEDLGAYIPMSVFSQLKSEGTTISACELLHPSDDLIAEQMMERTQNWQQDSLSFFSGKSANRGITYHFLRGVFPCRAYMMEHYSVKSPNRVYFYYLSRIGTGTIKSLRKLLNFLIA